MKRIFLSTLCIWVGFFSLAQHNNFEIVQLNETLNSKVEISGIAYYQANFYFISEKKSCLYKFAPYRNKDSFYQVNSPVDLKIQSSELEGLAVYNNYLLITDERNAKIYAYDLEENNTLPYPLDIKGFDVSGDVGFFGMEGIAVNQKNGICYLLKERNQNYESEIRQFKIIENTNGTITLLFKSNFRIENERIAEADNNWRYSDIYFDPTSNLLYGIKSSYVNGNGQYYIDTISCNPQTGLINDTVYKKDRKIHFSCLTKLMNDSFAESEYNTNLEGIVIVNGCIYVISDNYQSPRDYGKKTLLIKLPINKTSECK